MRPSTLLDRLDTSEAEVATFVQANSVSALTDRSLAVAIGRLMPPLGGDTAKRRQSALPAHRADDGHCGGARAAGGGGGDGPIWPERPKAAAPLLTWNPLNTLMAYSPALE